MRAGLKCRCSGRSFRAVPALLAMLVVLVTMLVACTDLTTSGSAVTVATEALATITSSVSPSTDAVTTTNAAATSTTTAVSGVSAESIAYAASLGGSSHLGEELYFVIGASVQTEEQAKALLEGAKAVGDMQSSFIVQLSDNFEGMRAGYWVVFEAYHAYPSVEDLEFCRRPFPDAYVKKATVRTSDPIPVR